MVRRQLDLITLSAITALAVVAILTLPAQQPVRVALALPLVLLMPGYALVAAAFPPRPDRTLDGWERLLLSVGVSLASVALIGYVLNLLPGGLTETSWTAVLAGVTIGAGVVGMLRRRGHRPPEVAAVGLGGRGAVLLIGAVVVALSALLFARAAASDQRSPGFTQLWLVPAGQRDGQMLRLGVRSFEEQPVRYRVRVLVNGKAVIAWPVISLTPQQTWETTIALPSRRPRRVDVFLYRGTTSDKVYRWVNWVG